MLFYIRFAGEEHKVRVESRDRQLFVSYDDGPEESVDLVFHGNECSFLHDSSVFHANIAGDKTDYKVGLPTGTLNFVVESEYRRIMDRLRGQSLEEENKITAKMPGKIVKIQVKEGDEVKQGDSIVVMEAMKMENDILTTMDGKVQKICVEEGQAVDAGELLVELETPNA